jgi:hypothetical protein
VLELTGFDVPPGYVGVNGRPTGHLVVEARPHQDSPSKPCIGAKQLANLTVHRWTVAQYNCPEDSAVVEREAMHGEGAYTGHLLFAWTQNGIDYIASAHGHTAVNRQLLRQLVESMSLVPPTR